MSTFKILIVDYPWPDLEIESRILSEIDGELIVAADSDAKTLSELAVDADAIMTCWAQVPQSVIAASTRCKLVARFGIGLDNIDIDACTRRGIPVTNVPDYCMTEVAEHTIALLFALARKVAFFHNETMNGRYDLNTGLPIRCIKGKTLGIVGFGRIGQCVAKKAIALGLRVMAHTRTPSDFPDVEFWSLAELVAQSDFVSLHLPLADETRSIIGAPQFAAMKPTAFVINTSRGDLIDHTALAEALDQGQVAGAALDVQSPEPPDLSQPPYCDPRVIVTPHAAFVSTESVKVLRERATQQVAARLKGEIPDHVVNPTVFK